MSTRSDDGRPRGTGRRSVPVQDDILAGPDMDTAPEEPVTAEANLEAEQPPEPQPEPLEPDPAEAHAEEQTQSPEVEYDPPRADFRDKRIKMLEESLEERERMLQDYIRAHKKAQVEFESFKTRMKANEAGYADATRGKVVERMLDVYDNLSRSLEASRTADTVDDLRAGIELVARDFLQRLEELGLERFDPIGQPFDPNCMEAMGVVPVAEDERNGKVVMTLKPGFRLKDREIRPAMVQVGRKF